MYLTYTEYTNYGGQMSESKFNRFAFRAGAEINTATLGRIHTIEVIPECVKRCEYELILYLSQFAKNGTAESVSSVSNDGYSISYNNQKTAQEQIYDIIYTYLSGTGLMYCGTDGVSEYNLISSVPDNYAYLLVKKE